jgi:hypothetical protein
MPGRYEPLGARVYWIHGNNDNFDASITLPTGLRWRSPMSRV